jgi:chromosome partitioning protein
LLVIPAVPSGIDTVGLVQTVRALRECNARYRVLLTKVPPPPEQEAQQLRSNLSSLDVPLFAAEIPRLKAFDRASMLVSTWVKSRATRTRAAHGKPTKQQERR